jgi:hypothetical protein
MLSDYTAQEVIEVYAGTGYEVEWILAMSDLTPRCGNDQLSAVVIDHRRLSRRLTLLLKFHCQ